MPKLQLDPMVDDCFKVWLWVYALICISLFLPLGIWGMRDPLSLTPLLVTGGIIESLPAAILPLASVLSLAVLWRRPRIKRGRARLVVFSALCLFLAGEEAEWGRDAVLGWQLPVAFGPADLHNGVMHLLTAMLGKFWGNDLSGMTLILLLGAGAVVALGSLLLLTSMRRKKGSTTQDRVVRISVARMFFFLGVSLMVTGNLFDALWHVGVPYFRGQWVLEESLELLGSVAFLFAVLSKIRQQVREGYSEGLANEDSRAISDNGMARSA